MSLANGQQPKILIFRKIHTATECLEFGVLYRAGTIRRVFHPLGLRILLSEGYLRYHPKIKRYERLK